MDTPEIGQQSLQEQPRVQWRALILGCAPVFINLLVYTTSKATPITTALLYPILGAGIMIATLWVILRKVWGEKFANLNLKPERKLKDIIHGVQLGVYILILGIVLSPIYFAELNTHYSYGSPGETYFNRLAFIWDSGTSEECIYLEAVFLIAIVGAEELTRAFLISRWMKLSQSKSMMIAGIFVSALVVGLAQAYLGLAGYLIATLTGLLLGFWYWRKGRVIQLVIARFLFSVVQFLFIGFTFVMFEIAVMGMHYEP